MRTLIFTLVILGAVESSAQPFRRSIWTTNDPGTVIGGPLLSNLTEYGSATLYGINGRQYGNSNVITFDTAGRAGVLRFEQNDESGEWIEWSHSTTPYWLLGNSGAAAPFLLKNATNTVISVGQDNSVSFSGNVSVDSKIILADGGSNTLYGPIWQGTNSIFSRYFPAGAPEVARHNLFFGPNAGSFGLLYSADTNVNSGSHNVVFGDEALMNNTYGYANCAFGYTTMKYNTLGYHNAAFGDDALQLNTSGFYNTAVGILAGYSNTTGKQSTSVGHGALYTSNGDFNTAVGNYALRYLAAGVRNSAVGDYCLYNALGNANAAIGQNALYTTQGGSNVAVGAFAGFHSTGSSELWIDNATRASEADAKVKALVYGNFHANPTAQLFRVNAKLEVNGNVGIGTNTPQAVAHVTGTGSVNDLLRLGTTAADSKFSVDTNGTATTKSLYVGQVVSNPVGCYGALMMNATNIVICHEDAGVYTNAAGTGYTTIVTNGFYGDITGTSAALTNLIAGFYRVSVSYSALGANAQPTEWDAFTNGVSCDLISIKKTFDNPARMDSGAASAIIYLPANCRTDFRVQDAGTGASIAVHRASLVIGTP